MKKHDLLRRYIFFTLGLFVNSLGISLVTRQIWAPRRFPAFPIR